MRVPERAAKWRKDQIADNYEIARLVARVNRKLEASSGSIDLLFAPFPLGAFQPIKAKIRGSRYFAQVYVRINNNEIPEEALQRILGDEMRHIEVKPK